jgi:mycothiol synthase
MHTLMRTFTPDDYPALIAVFNAARSDYHTTVEGMLAEDEAARRSPKCRFQRYVVERDGRIVALGHYDQPPRFYSPRTFRANILVHPRYQGHGIGTMLFERIKADLESFNALSAFTMVREDMLRGVQFAKKCGFYEEHRIWKMRLDVAAFDLTPYTGLSKTLDDQGIEIKTLKELEADEERNQKVYDLTIEVGKDLPPTERWTQPGYEDFLRYTLNNPPFSSETYFVAVHHNTYVGLSYLIPHKEENYCGTGLTGVKRAYRHKGVALALKLCGIAYARTHGYVTLRTSTDEVNRAMLSINERLGFVKQPAWIVFEKLFAST